MEEWTDYANDKRFSQYSGDDKVPAKLYKTTMTLPGDKMYVLSTIADSNANSADSINTSVGGIIQLALSLTGLVFMIFIFYGGILWMTAAGTEKRIDRAKKIMSESIIGLLIVFLAYAITFFIINVFSGQKLLD